MSPILHTRLRLLQQSLSATQFVGQQRTVPSPTGVGRRYLGCLPVLRHAERQPAQTAAPQESGRQ
jgi:hypothetical protein